MASFTELPALGGRDEAADRATLDALVALQLAAAAAPGAAPAEAATWCEPLEAFRESHLGVAADARGWRRAADALVADALAQPQAPLLARPGQCGPITQDIARLLQPVLADEAVAIDLAVRWWQAARRAGLPVDADFGDCWRGIEWQGLWLALDALGRGPTDAEGLAPVVRTALRYAPLKPLLPLLQPLSGAAPAAGFTF